MKIRPYQDSDQDAVVQLWQRCNLTRPWNDPVKDIARKLQVQPELFLVGLMDDVIVSSVLGGYDGHRGWAYYLAVDPDHQREGLGRQIMDELERLLLERGCPKLDLMIRDTNRVAIDFYERIGYKLDPVITMSKRLIPDQ